MTRAEFAEALFTYCAITSASVTSYIRTRERNRDVGGVENSGHRFGLAADVQYDGEPSPSARNELAKRLGLRLFIEPEHDHVQPIDWLPG